MKDTLDKQLCEEYPKIFAERNQSMQKTAMCWGFEHGDGWHDLLRVLCGNIQQHVDWTRKQRNNALRFNRALIKAIDGDKQALQKHFSVCGKITQWSIQMAEEAIVSGRMRIVLDACPQVVASQVKEKFGTLRFYYSGGDDTIDGMVRMAETMSECICEVCGNKGKSNSDGWIRVLCDNHLNEQKERNKGTDQ